MTQQYDKAESILRKILSLDKEDHRANAILAFTFTRQNKHSESIEYYVQALSTGQVTYDICALYAISLNALGEIDESIKWNKRALLLLPTLVDVTKTLSMQLEKKGQIKEAINLLQDFDKNLVKKGKNPVFPVDISLIKEKYKLN